jgi:N-acetylneuraminate lyase
MLDFILIYFQAAHAEKFGASGIGILPNCFERPRNLDDLIDWVAKIAEAAPNTPCLYYHLPKYTHVECKNV